LNPGMLAIGALIAFTGPYFPSASLRASVRADTRRCTLGAQATQSDCALVGAQWVLTSAGTVATARPVGGRLHVRIGDEEYAVEQLVYHPKWNGGGAHDVTLLKLANRVPSFPVLPLPGEFPLTVERIAQRALPERAWVAQTIGPSPLWDDRKTTALATKPAPILTRVRSLVDSWTGRTSND
jgi:trypsin